jgi:hypothetical protein
MNDVKPPTSLARIHKIFTDLDCKRILVKDLAANDNSKNQIYFGPNFEAANLFPNLNIVSSDVSKANSIFKANLTFYWIDNDGLTYPAPYSQIIFYPQYPEIRWSGFLKGCSNAPSELMASRLEHRALFLGIRNDGTVFGFVSHPREKLYQQCKELNNVSEKGVFLEITDGYKKGQQTSKGLLIQKLRDINHLGWIDSIRLDANNNTLPCASQNCGGYTLEAKFGIRPNGNAEPDFKGWELKQHAVDNFKALESGVLTLMTPEPTGGVYKDQGAEHFVRKYGYKDTKGRPDRLNFGGTHYFNDLHERTHLILKLDGYKQGPEGNESKLGKITDSNGGLVLVDQKDNVAARWDFPSLMSHWNKKHNQAAYVPSMMRKTPKQQYFYGDCVRLGEGTDFFRFLNAVARQKIYYDPGIKVEGANTSRPKVKKRSQFRIRSKDLSSLYRVMTLEKF